MGLKTHRLSGTVAEPFTIEIDNWVSGSNLLWHLSGALQNAQVIAKKSWAMTDDFEAYFLYKGRLFILYSPLAKILVSLIGQPADRELFEEVEAKVKSYPAWRAFLVAFAVARYAFVPSNPPPGFVEAHETGRSQGHAV
jgi:hypothetical protein